jgi:hypothetical protein
MITTFFVALVVAHDIEMAANKDIVGQIRHRLNSAR